MWLNVKIDSFYCLSWLRNLDAESFVICSWIIQSWVPQSRLGSGWKRRFLKSCLVAAQAVSLHHALPSVFVEIPSQEGRGPPGPPVAPPASLLHLCASHQQSTQPEMHSSPPQPSHGSQELKDNSLWRCGSVIWGRTWHTNLSRLGPLELIRKWNQVL